MNEQPTRRVRRKRQTLWNTAPLLVCIVAFGLIYLLTGCFGLNAKDDAAPPAPPAVPAANTEPPASAAPTEDVPASDTAEPAPETTEEATEPPAPAEKTFTAVDASYFDDALFIGDSRTDGLRLYDPPGSGADFYCGTSMTIFGVLDSTETTNGVTGFENVLAAKQYGKVYIMFGINECGYDTDYFLDWYKSVIERIRSYQPNALIYIQSILYVTQAKENAMSVFASDKLKEKNAGLRELANGEDVFYLEVNDALNDGTDHLPSDYTGDGVHLYANYYYLWRDYLREHAIVDDAHPWAPPAEEPEEDSSATDTEAAP